MAVLQESDERSLSVVLTEAVEVSVQLHTFPKALVEAYVVVLEAGAG